MSLLIVSVLTSWKISRLANSIAAKFAGDRIVFAMSVHCLIPGSQGVSKRRPSTSGGAVLLSKKSLSKIIAYSVTDIIHINSTVNRTAGEHKSDIVGLPVDSCGFKCSRRYRGSICRGTVCPTVKGWGSAADERAFC